MHTCIYAAIWYLAVRRSAVHSWARPTARQPPRSRAGGGGGSAGAMDRQLLHKALRFYREVARYIRHMQCSPKVACAIM